LCKGPFQLDHNMPFLPKEGVGVLWAKNFREAQPVCSDRAQRTWFATLDNQALSTNPV